MNVLYLDGKEVKHKGFNDLEGADLIIVKEYGQLITIAKCSGISSLGNVKYFSNLCDYNFYKYLVSKKYVFGVFTKIEEVYYELADKEPEFFEKAMKEC